ncbi:MAG: aminotransferase class I/II-fold pyridoxal phosphate-dependent enzyme [Pseudomonadales bacterium]|nr:aminotransferase class I/II-fold pyridoxal phosphate-dependent enzyme [Pseudomonadales bacterium]
MSPEAPLQKAYEQFKSLNLNLDITRGKPCSEQLDLSVKLDGILNGNYISDEGIDCRNYGGLGGLQEARKIGTWLLDSPSDEIIVGSNSSLTFMYQYISQAHHHGLEGDGSAWNSFENGVRFLCPTPGYDRHFSICEHLGIEMIPVAMTGNGPNMDQVEALMRSDDSIRGLWCVPKYANPSGDVYSDETVARIAKLGALAASDFRVFWDNAYSVHDLTDQPAKIADIRQLSLDAGTENNLVQFASTSKITFAGAGISFLSSTKKNLKIFTDHLGFRSIGPDKINQLRHARFFETQADLNQHMKKHAAIIQPKFNRVLELLNTELGDQTGVTWTQPKGGYFISFNTQPGLAKEVVKLCAEAGVKLTPAGASFPYGNDPQDSNIRLAPTFPTIDDVDQAIRVFIACVKLATARLTA